MKNPNFGTSRSLVQDYWKMFYSFLQRHFCQNKCAKHQQFLLLTNVLIFDKNFYFGQMFWFLTKILIFDENFYLTSKIWPQISDLENLTSKIWPQTSDLERLRWKTSKIYPWKIVLNIRIWSVLLMWQFNRL